MESTWTRYGAKAFEALAGAVTRAQGADPLAPVHVATPNRYAALAARRVLAARPRGLANVRCEPLPRIAELLAGPALIASGRRPLHSARWAHAVRAALPGPNPPLPTVRAHVRAFAELRSATEAQLRVLAESNEQAGETVRRYRAARAVVADTFDTEDALRTTIELLRADEACRTALGAVVLWLPTQATPAELELLIALAQAGQLASVFGFTGDPTADARVQQLATDLGAVAPPPATEPTVPAHVTLRRAPDPEEEVRAALRSIVASASTGVPLHDHAILVPDLNAYGRIVHEQAAAAGIPIAGPDARTLADTMFARFLSATLQLDLESLHRDEYVAWLTSAPILDPGTGTRARSTRWDLLTRSAGLIADATSFVPALERFISQRRHDLATTPPGDDDAGKRRAIARDIDDATALASFTEALCSALAAPATQPWSDWVTWCRTIVATYLGPETRRRSWPDREANAAVRIDAMLDRLAELGAEPVSRATFADAFADELESPSDAIGRFGTGVFVGRIVDAAGITCAHVTLLGVTDGRFPASRRDDPLLPDRARAAAGLTTRAERRNDNRAAFLAAVRAGRHSVCSFPVADPRRQRPALPSRWLVQWASTHAGSRLGADALRSCPAAPWLEVIPSFAAGLQATPALHLADAELVDLMAGTPVSDPDLARSLSAGEARRARTLTPSEGAVGPHPDILTADSLSPTSLERWARCPRSFFFEKVLGLTDVQRPEALDTIRADERGSLVHVVLDRFIREARPRTGSNDRWDATDRKVLDIVFGEECAIRATDGRVGRPVRWLVEQRRLRRQLHAFLDQDNEVRAALGVVPDATELAFGVGDAHQDAVRLPGLPALHGIADRVDVSSDGATAVVYDYKTGAPTAYKGITADDPTAQGTRLQLPVYALAARDRTGARTVRSAYWFITEDATATHIPLELTDTVMTAFERAVTTINAGIQAGLFPAVPGPRTRSGHAHCDICPFDRICPADRARIWERVQADPQLAPWHHLAETETEDAP